MGLDQSKMPLVSALQRCADRPNAAFYTPGHKRGQGASASLRQLLGSAALRADLPELPELDNLFAPEGVIAQAQQLAAQAFGAQQTWFLANGSTCGVEAAILATCGPGDKLILPRNVHSSAISGLILSGAMPIYVSPIYSRDWTMALGVRAADIEAALALHPEAKAVLVVSPTYHGVCSDLAAIAQLAHTRNVPLIVDEAHGPHFAFHPQLPISALQAGADIAVQSAHKVLSSLTQSALLHTQGDRIDRARLSQALQLTQSTSPSYLLLASLDAARCQMVMEGERLMSNAIALADRAFDSLSQLEGLRVLQPAWHGVADRCDRTRLTGDRTRLTIEVFGLGLTGFDADEMLHEQCQVTAELPALRHITFIVSLGNNDSDIDRLIAGFKTLCRACPPEKEGSLGANQAQSGKPLSPETAVGQETVEPLILGVASVSPRQAFFAGKTARSLEDAVGSLCAETICPYPPGIPVLLAGEQITADAIASLRSILSAGGTLSGCIDPTLKTILTIT